jgi:hypothetical protein
LKTRRIGLISLMLCLVTLLAACSGSKHAATSTASGGDSAATSSGSVPNTPPVDLATAYQNLVNQQSFVMTAKLSNLQGSLAKLPGITDPTTIKMERAGNDRHVQVITSTNRTLFELWRVNNQLYINIGLGATKTSENDSIVKQFLPLLDADTQIVNALASGKTTYSITGTARVNGVQSNVEQARYDLAQVPGSIFSTGANTTVDAKISVAQSGSYLVKADLTLSERASGSPVAGTATTNSGAHVVIDITQIGTLKAIKAPL